MMSFLEVQNISRLLANVWVVNDVSFIQQPQQRIAIAGETGSGKSSLLKMIAGLVQPDNGNSFFLDERIEGPYEKLIPGHPGIAYLSQQFELPKFLRVEQVLEYANKLTTAEANTLYEVCQITHLMKRRTDQLSGGEQQRTALARLLIGSPKLLLLDEPFSNLDPIHKNTLKTVLEDAENHLQVSFILTSHDPQDTLPWADEIMVMKDGKFLQQASPEVIYHQPSDEYVAGLFGKYNLVSPATMQLFSDKQSVSSKNKIIVRPEDFQIVASTDSNINGLIRKKQFVGNGYEIETNINEEIITIRTNDATLKKGDSISLKLQERK